VMEKGAAEAEIAGVAAKIEALGFTAQPMPGGERVAIGILRNPGPVDPALFVDLPGVQEAIPVSRPYKLVSREMQRQDTIVDLGPGLKIGGGHFVVIAGPCAVESEAQALTIARAVQAAGARIFRGGAFKPRTSPYSYQGLEEEGLKILARVRAETGMPVITEAIDHASLDLVEAYADIIQIGARNMQNFSLLRGAGKARRPVLLKRGLSATLDELLMAAEYILSEGNYRVILCERGIRTFADHVRNTLDLSVIPAVQRLSHLPILVDPSHGTGRREKVIPLSRAAVAVGADGLIVEVHHNPDEALSDGYQSIRPADFDRLMTEIRGIAAVLGRTIGAVPDRTASGGRQ
jgi:3-deoxy-7-phosphoheptulonate synthase